MYQISWNNSQRVIFPLMCFKTGKLIQGRPLFEVNFYNACTCVITLKCYIKGVCVCVCVGGGGGNIVQGMAIIQGNMVSVF